VEQVIAAKLGVEHSGNAQTRDCTAEHSLANNGHNGVPPITAASYFFSMTPIVNGESSETYTLRTG
jgi:hypothetical protein